MLQTESLRKQSLALAPRMWEIRRKLQSRGEGLVSPPPALGSTFIVVSSSPPVMAWRHPDVCNRHQKSQARGGEPSRV
ncbi:hypothetical protein V8C35DRAFT_317457 [Trichoderma chlorosporum]